MNDYMNSLYFTSRIFPRLARYTRAEKKKRVHVYKDDV